MESFYLKIHFFSFIFFHFFAGKCDACSVRFVSAHGNEVFSKSVLRNGRLVEQDNFMAHFLRIILTHLTP